ncbi:Por secretion system C-terminal sorting domain-containing protein [Chryseobacterium sp. RU37D]|uniref:fibronectin type III domain-containing protein n=1 Tax=Chryseobacterium sp. RU37D TaxID=1907397 RepID=UPI000953E4F9|nr:fibronectin type III domain-containing protein [Chryseobacterium sp. RU37D]SIQ18013.1 Por secretion system C-terminal sorting domain-containing protein [Chryseobacterium sp. RU37D]
MKKLSTFLVLLLCLINLGAIPAVYGQAPATLPYSQDFNTTNDFTLLNGTQTNKWVYGAFTGNTGSSIYVSNDNGISNAYTINSSSTVQAYRDFTIPVGSTIANFSFDWKSGGESTWDYIKVWVVPATFTPTPGTQISAGTGRTQLAQLNLQSTWQNYSLPNLNVAPYAGNTMRLVFEWRNDGTGGTQPAIAIDNINISIPTCIMPSGMTASAIGATTATLSWTAPSPVPGNGYEYYLSTTNTAPVAATTGISNAGTTVTPTLAPVTTYFWWVRSICSGTDKSVWMAGPSFTTTQIPTTVPYTQDFSTGNDLQLNNGTQTNKWFYGTALGNPANSLYISNDNGVSNAYSIGSSSVVQAYRDIAIPVGTTDAALSFDWKAEGESSWDYLRVWLVPTSFVPTPGTQIGTGGGRIQVGGNFNQQTTWQNYLNTSLNLSSFAGQTMRLVFEWRNDGSGGTQPPAAIDNINLSIPTCKVPSALAVSNVTTTTATINWTAPTPIPVGGYQYYLTTTNVSPIATTAPTGSSATTTALLSSLTPNTTYYFWVRSVCVASDKSFWVAGPSFTTPQIPTTIPYYQDFSTNNDLGFTGSTTQTNKWFYGNATGNPARSIYISNDNGTTNAYTTSASSVVHAYRDITVPTGTTNVTFSFDWKAQGEGSWDYLRVWLVPVTFMPTAGTQITTGAGRIQIGTNYNQQDTWQSYLNPNLNISSFAGQTMRLVFEWRNDGTGGNQPPAAIDNIKLRICSTATPTVTVATPTHNSVVLTWPQDNGGASYTIRYRPVGSTTWLMANIAAAPFPTPTNTTTLTNLLSATQYEVEVAAVCNGTLGVFSHNEFLTRCDPTPPNVTISNITTTSALVTWSPLAASSHYYLRYRIVGSGPTGWNIPNITLPAAPANTYTLTNLNVYTTYEVQIANMCDNETTLNTWSNPKVFTTERTCDIAPPGLTITNLTTTTAVVTWDPFPGATYILRYRKVGIPSWTNIPSSTNTVTLTGLTELTQYEMQVVNICNGTPGTYTQPYIFTTPTVVYCQMESTISSSEYISKVTMTPNGKPEMVNESQASNYSDYTGVPVKFIELIQGSSNNKITIDKKLSGNANAGVAVWIDFNRNGYFDINERIFVAPSNNEQTVSGTFSVPADAFISMTDYKYVVMRVAMQKDGIPVNCTSFPTGEVEDYTVRISKPAIPNSVNQNDILIFPNPVKTILNVKNISKKANYKIYNTAGQVVSSGIILNNKIDVHNLINGVYIIDIEDAQGTTQKKFIKE